MCEKNGEGSEDSSRATDRSLIWHRDKSTKPTPPTRERKQLDLIWRWFHNAQGMSGEAFRREYLGGLRRKYHFGACAEKFAVSHGHATSSSTLVLIQISKSGTLGRFVVYQGISCMIDHGLVHGDFSV